VTADVITMKNPTVTTVLLTPDTAQQIFGPLIETVIKPNADKVLAIHEKGGIAIAVSPRITSESKRDLRAMGLTGKAGVFEMPEAARQRVAQTCRSMGDTVTPAWLTEKREHVRVFAWIGAGNVQMNVDYDGKWSLEPKSTSGDGLI
jgi:hypothetical protein